MGHISVQYDSERSGDGIGPSHCLDYVIVIIRPAQAPGRE